MPAGHTLNEDLAVVVLLLSVITSIVVLAVGSIIAVRRASEMSQEPNGKRAG
ncbi:hypothetical protein ACQPZZ_35380 [Microbispora sp. CA-135349]|uniref:hypothetical protein n=1 Tax=Microbispora sp. CA-135349 TaxID=3239953 RepID=UPI003D8C20E8